MQQVIVQYLSRAADEAQDPQLAKLIRKGVAIHNSGLSPGDRGLVERAFLSGRQVLPGIIIVAEPSTSNGSAACRRIFLPPLQTDWHIFIPFLCQMMDRVIRSSKASNRIIFRNTSRGTDLVPQVFCCTNPHRILCRQQ